MAHKDDLDSAIVYDRDYDYNYFGFKELMLFWSAKFIYIQKAIVYISLPETPSRGVWV